ncbi:N-lysine methyltransferase setd6 [Liparis tanakae]|uniref:N-lysine methyltransferase setd6 n=1 Tax=Liparis tanakae TaxID=230148 RepID=A0A4Z2GCJ2_9TELE|nr:N-lysine methyltransferase setd6 [Liparis tanakae]
MTVDICIVSNKCDLLPVLLVSLSLHAECPQDSLKMVCVRPILKGDEVFNTYGQRANWQLLHMYGFTEPYRSNGNDTADVPVANLYKVAMQGVQSDPDRQLVEKQWEMLCQMMREKGSFVFGKQGCLTDAELQTALKMMCMSKEEFSDFKDNEGWEEDEEDEIPLPFSNEDLPGLKASLAGTGALHHLLGLLLSHAALGHRLEQPEGRGQTANVC